MAAERTDSKRKLIEVSNALISVTLCKQCELHYNKTDRAPHNLNCGHTFCRACLNELVATTTHQTSDDGIISGAGGAARTKKRNQLVIKCPHDGVSTRVAKKAGAASLPQNLALSAATLGAPIRRFFVQNLAGTRFQMLCSPGDSIAAAKRQLQQEHPQYPAHLQVWSVVRDDDSDSDSPATTPPRVVELFDTQSVEECQLGDSYVTNSVSMFVQDGFPGGSCCRALKLAINRNMQPEGIAASPNGKLLAIGYPASNCIELLKLDGRQHVIAVQTIHGENGVFRHLSRSDLCFSPDSEHLFAIDRLNELGCVLQFLTSSGRMVRQFAPRGHGGQIGASLTLPIGICMSPSGVLFVGDTIGNRIQTYTLDGEYIGQATITKGTGPSDIQAPGAICVSPNGELLFVCDRGNRRVQVYRTSDFAHVRSIGSNGNARGQFEFPDALATSKDGEWLFVADSGQNRVQVFRVSDGSYAHSALMNAPHTGAGSHEGQFDSPHGMCVTAEGKHLLVADTRNRRIQAFHM